MVLGTGDGGWGTGGGAERLKVQFQTLVKHGNNVDKILTMI